MPDIIPTSRSPVAGKCILGPCAVCVLEEEEFPGYWLAVALAGEVDCWDCCGACSEKAEEGEEGGGLHCLETGVVWTDWDCECSSGISCRAEQCLWLLVNMLIKVGGQSHQVATVIESGPIDRPRTRPFV